MSGSIHGVSYDLINENGGAFWGAAFEGLRV
jgi:hypothetical protein